MARTLKLGAGAVLAAAVLLLFAGSLNAANWYVRSGGAGSRTGTDWNNAWDCGGIGWSSVNGGDTIWMAGGTYSSQIRPTKSGSSGNYIYVKRVLSTDAVPVAAAGWSSAFDSQVVVNTPSAACISFSSANVGSYTYWDGRVSAGIRLKHGDTTSYLSSAAVVFPTTAGGQQYITFKNIDMAGAFGSGPGTPVGDYGVVNLNSVSHITFSHCWIHGDPTLAFLSWTTGITFEYCKLYDSVAGGAIAHQNLLYLTTASETTFRYNEVWNWAVEGIWINGNSGAVYVYGNVFRDPYSTAQTRVNRCFQCGSWLNTSGQQGPLYVYNNTFLNVDGIFYPGQDGVAWASGSIARNNIVWNSDGWPGVNSDYTYADYNTGEAHGVNGSGQTPFVNLAARDLRIVGTIGAGLPRNKGTALTSPSSQTYHRDGNETVRGADGAWDIGAYEYGSVSTNPVISVAPGSLSSTFGLGTTNSLILQVQNSGGGTLAGSATVIGATGVYTLLSGQSYSLTAGQSQQVTVRCVPATTNDGVIMRFTGGGGVDVPVTNRAQLPLGLSFAATAGLITAPFAISGGYVSQAVETGVGEGGQASYTFVITNAGNYTVSTLVNAPGDAANSFFVNIDGMPTDPTMIWDVAFTAGFENRTVSWRGNGTHDQNEFVPKVFSLAPGVHQLFIVGREPNAQLGQITIAPYSSPRPDTPEPPENLRVVSSQ